MDDRPWTYDAYLVLHLWVEPDGEVRGRVTHPRGPGLTDAPAAGSGPLVALVGEALRAVLVRLRTEAARHR